MTCSTVENLQAPLKDRITALEAALAAEIRQRLEAQIKLEQATATLGVVQEEHKNLQASHESLKQGVQRFSEWLALHLPYKNLSELNPIREAFRRWVRS